MLIKAIFRSFRHDFRGNLMGTFVAEINENKIFLMKEGKVVLMKNER